MKAGLLALFLIGLCSFAEHTAELPLDQLPLFHKPSDPEIRLRLWEKVGGEFAGTPVVRARFSQTKRIQALRRPLISSGTFLYAKDHGVFWDFENPSPTRYIITENAIMEESGDGPPRITTASDQPRIREFGALFLSVFTGQFDLLDDKFNVKVEWEEDDWMLGLTPKSPLLRRVISHIVINGDTRVERVRILETNGDLTDLRFLDPVPAEHLTDEERARFESLE